ncbi:murein L,D-transpeptidase catalytic domain family protein [candidate division WOR-3 bacterium]|nr:murein L,D-transpeptidase catalytic domain family protein [candidate division WOR-3 bacterium]
MKLRLLFLLIVLFIYQSRGFSLITAYNEEVIADYSHTQNFFHKEMFKMYIKKLYKECGLVGKLHYKVFRLAVIGYINMKAEGFLSDKAIITVIDYTISANEKRFFVIDLDSKELLYNTLVAHGKNTGNKYAKYFSNEPKSCQSCFGFFITAEAYYGKHGYSLKLDGVDTLFNDNARKRSVVMHGAHYVSQDFIKQYGRLGRSWGCPALSKNKSKCIIDTIKHGCCLFIYYNDKNYLNTSKYLDIHTLLLHTKLFFLDESVDLLN